MMNKDFLVSTTHSLEGYNIEEYYGYISTNLVIGADVFSDISASFTDFFGGISGHYTNEIDTLMETSSICIKNKAKALGMNAIIGFKTELNPIFGSGYSMFMISATGTTVKIKKIGEKDTVENKEDVIRDALINVYTSSKVSNNNFNILNNSLQEIEGYIGQNNNIGLSIVQSIENGIIANKNTYAIDKNFLRFNIINEYLAKCDDYKDTIEYVSTDISDVKAYIIRKFDLISYKKIYEQLQKSTDIKDEMVLFHCLEASPKFISKEEYKYLSLALDFIKNKYNDDVEIKKVGLVKSKLIWTCKKCNTNVDADRGVCHLCDHNKFGLPVRYKNLTGKDILVNLSSIVEKLEQIKSILSTSY